MLHGETLVFITTAIVATVAEVENGSTLRETCLATQVSRNQPCCTLPFLLKPVSQRLCTQVSTCNSGLMQEPAYTCLTTTKNRGSLPFRTLVFPCLRVLMGGNRNTTGRDWLVKGYSCSRSYPIGRVMLAPI